MVSKYDGDNEIEITVKYTDIIEVHLLGFKEMAIVF